MQITYYRDGKITVEIPNHKYTSNNSMMSMIARWLQQTGRNVTPIATTMCASIIRLDHPIEDNLLKEYQANLSDNQNQCDVDAEDPVHQEDILEYVDPPILNEEEEPIPIHYL